MKLRVLHVLFAFFTLAGLQAQITTVGVIGSAGPYGWDADTSMVQDAVNPDLWTIDLFLNAGEAKFRANDAWTINWGDVSFPIGTGTQDGPNIPIPASGMHHITFNSATGEYYFSVASDIGIIGSAAPFGWDADVNLYQDPVNTDLYSISMALAGGEAKFRQNDDWAINWGDVAFPTGIGTQNGPNIPVNPGGDYDITFNKATGEYSFTLTSFASVGIIGDATPGGWGAVTELGSGSGVGDWTATIELTDGGLQFSADAGSATWGGTEFPSGVAELDGDTIPITAGTYIVNFNTKTLAYSFQEVVEYATVGIIGDATPGGWDNDTDMEKDAVDPFLWTLRVILTDGEAKFRADNDWAVNWGSADFPIGTAIRDGDNIPITAGEYNITFNTLTGAYRFQELLIYDRVGMVGTATPNASWDIDHFMTKSAEDENVWTMQEITLSTNPMKFRADSAWTVNWGADSWPTGTGTQDGPNIPAVAGTYGVTLNSASGEYVFGPPLVSTKDVLNPASIKAYPNPATDLLLLDLTAVELRGEVTLTVFDINGKEIRSEVQQGNAHMQLRVADLQSGYYTLHISNEEYIIGKKFVIAR